MSQTSPNVNRIRNRVAGLPSSGISLNQSSTPGQKHSHPSTNISGSAADTYASHKHTSSTKIPFPPAEIRRRGKKGSQRSALIVFNLAHAKWTGIYFNPSETTTHAVTSECARRIRAKIRSFLYTTQGGGDCQIEQGAYSYDQAKAKFGKQLALCRRKLDGSYSQLQCAEDGWASDLFIVDVFKMDRKYKKASSDWVHPNNRTHSSPNHENSNNHGHLHGLNRFFGGAEEQVEPQQPRNEVLEDGDDQYENSTSVVSAQEIDQNLSHESDEIAPLHVPPLQPHSRTGFEYSSRRSNDDSMTDKRKPGDDDDRLGSDSDSDPPDSHKNTNNVTPSESLLLDLFKGDGPLELTPDSRPRTKKNFTKPSISRNSSDKGSVVDKLLEDPETRQFLLDRLLSRNRPSKRRNTCSSWRK